MKILPEQLEEGYLVELGARASQLLLERDFERLASEYGYAVSLGRNPAVAIEEDLTSALAEIGETHFAIGPEPHFFVRILPPRGELHAIIESRLATRRERRVLLEVVVSQFGGEYFATLEQVSAAA